MKAEDQKTFLSSAPEVLGDCTLPLFPLGTWLYPDITLPLQIFEPRYLTMISERLKKQAGFGIVPIMEGREVGTAPEIHPVGVEVEVVDWYQQSNGLLGIKVSGKQRFRVLNTEVNDDQLMLGDVEYLPLEQDEDIIERHSGLSQLLLELKQHPHADALELNEPQTSNQLSYQLSQLLPFEANKKLELMLASDPEQRLGIIAKQVFELANE